MNMDKYNSYYEQAVRLMKAVGLEQSKIPSLDRPTEGYFIRLRGTALEYVYTERGLDECRSTEDVRELLYWVFRDITASTASEFEAKNRIAGQDSRRQLFHYHASLLARLNPEWGRKVNDEYMEVLKHHPFRD